MAVRAPPKFPLAQNCRLMYLSLIIQLILAMKRVTFLLAGLTGIELNSLFAADAPRGSLMELHSCEVYAGPCVVNSETPQEGRCMVRAWDFTGGNFNGIDFNGLKIAVLQLSPDNLAETDSKSGNAVV